MVDASKSLTLLMNMFKRCLNTLGTAVIKKAVIGFLDLSKS